MFSHRRSFVLFTSIALQMLLAVGSMAATTWNVPGHFNTIQAAISSPTVLAGDTISVAAGTYVESLDWRNKDLTILGAGPGDSIIDCTSQPGARCVYTENLTAASRFQGFTLKGGSGSDGGGMYNFYSSPTIGVCNFEGNSTGNPYYGGAIYGDHCNSLMAWCIFVGNSAGNGGAIFFRDSAPTLAICLFLNNSAFYGGALTLFQSSGTTMTNCMFYGNRANDQGGAVFNNTSSPAYMNCVFSGNQAARTTTGGGGGAMYTYQGTPQLTNCTLTANSTGWYGGGFYNQSANMTLVNCIVWGNSAQSGNSYYNNNLSLPTVSYSDVQGYSPPVPGPGTFDADPLFARNPSPGLDGMWGTADDDYGDLHLQYGSPCLDTGNYTALPADSLDFDGDGDFNEKFPFDLEFNARISGSVVDIGAYEAQINLNRAPTLSVQANAAVNVGCPVTFAATATDPDNDSLTYSLPGGPSWASINSTGAVTLNPPAGTVGTFTLTVKVTDPSGASDQKNVTVTVCPIIIESVSLSRKKDVVTVQLSLRNTDGTIINNVSLNAATLRGVNTTTGMPITYPQLRPGMAKTVQLKFQNVSSGSATFLVTGTSSAGPVNAKLQVTVP